MLNQGIVLSREKIENHIWNFDYEGGTNVVDVYISYLRKKIDEGLEGLWLRGVVSEEQTKLEMLAITRLSLILMPVLMVHALFYRINKKC